MFLRYVLIGLVTGLVVGAGSAFVLSLGYESSETSDSVIGTGVLGAAAGGSIGATIAVVRAICRWLRGGWASRDRG